MFITKETYEQLQADLADCKRNYEEAMQVHKFRIAEKDFELKHFKDNEVKKLREENTKLQKEMAILEERTRQLEKLVDLNGDIVDVKSLIEKLIGKLPSIDLKNLTVNTSSK